MSAGVVVSGPDFVEAEADWLADDALGSVGFEAMTRTISVPSIASIRASSQIDCRLDMPGLSVLKPSPLASYFEAFI